MINYILHTWQKSAGLLFAIAIIAATSTLTFSQSKFCFTPEMNKIAEKENPNAIYAKKKLLDYTQQYIKQNKKSEEVYVIPVVFHVLHNYGSENISKEQIEDAVQILNNDFNKMNWDTIQIVSAFLPIVANCRIEFRLAKLDPEGNCTDGIVRTATAMTVGADDWAKQESPAWPRSQYLNIWTCKSLANGAAGYSYYPSSVDGNWGTDRDGVIILSTYVGKIGTGSTGTSRALTHEIGHYLNLAHTWGDSNDPGLPENCNTDDGIDDTPNTIGHTNCNVNASTCGFLDNVQNYMEYSYCCKMFTNGQKDWMRAALNSTTAERSSLWTPANLLATGTADGYVAQLCEPMPDFGFSNTLGCTESLIQFSQIIWNTDSITNVEWQFPGGTPSSSTELNPVVRYENPGMFSATLTATNPTGTNQITKTDIIQILDSTQGVALPWSENFESSLFPNVSSDASKNWLIRGNGNSLWTRTTTGSIFGSYCLRINNAQNETGQFSELFSPNIVFSDLQPASSMSFYMAYSQKESTNSDKLQVYVSYDCGETWSIKFSRSAGALSTTPGSYFSSFTPNASQWKLINLSLGSQLADKKNMRIKFLATSGGGNSIFLDNINLQSITSNLNIEKTETLNANVYPNPGNNESFLYFETLQPTEINISITDIIGKIIYNKTTVYNADVHSMPITNLLSEKLEKGIYLIKLKTSNTTEAIKFIVE